MRPPVARLAAVVAATAVLAVAGAPAGAAPAAVAATADQVYVAMGDSYTAGPLVPFHVPDPWGCLRSDHNYPHLVADAVGATLRDVSCSGADTADLSSAQDVAGDDNPPQLDALDPGVGTVNLQIGGNDIGFSEMPITAGDVPYLRAKEKERNAMLASQAAAAGAVYVDLYGPGVGHDAPASCPERAGSSRSSHCPLPRPSTPTPSLCGAWRPCCWARSRAEPAAAGQARSQPSHRRPTAGAARIGAWSPRRGSSSSTTSPTSPTW